YRCRGDAPCPRRRATWEGTADRANRSSRDLRGTGRAPGRRPPAPRRGRAGRGWPRRLDAAASPRRPAASREPDPWIDHGVEEVHGEIDEHEDQREDEDARLDDGEVAARNGLDDEASEPRPREDGLDHDGAAEHEAHGQTGDGEERDGRVPDRVTIQDETLGQPLRARC